MREALYFRGDAPLSTTWPDIVGMIKPALGTHSGDTCMGLGVLLARHRVAMVLDPELGSISKSTEDRVDTRGCDLRRNRRISHELGKKSRT